MREKFYNYVCIFARGVWKKPRYWTHLRTKVPSSGNPTKETKNGPSNLLVSYDWKLPEVSKIGKNRRLVWGRFRAIRKMTKKWKKKWKIFILPLFQEYISRTRCNTRMNQTYTHNDTTKWLIISIKVQNML